MEAIKNKFGICEWTLAENGTGALLTAARLGFDGVQISDLGGAGKGFPLLDERLADRYAGIRAQEGIEIPSLHTHALTREGGMRWPVESARGQEAVLSFRNALRVCRRLDIGTVMVASFDASGVANDYDMVNTGRMLELFARMAEDAGVRLAYEGVTTLDRIETILERTKGRVKLCYDTFNPIRFGHGQPLEELKRLRADLIDHVHLKDGPEDMVGCACLGTGCGRFAEVAAALDAMGVRGWFFVENYYYQAPLNAQGAGTELALRDLASMKKALGTDR